MALTKADKDWIDERIATAVKGTGWRRVGRFIKDWSLPSAVVGFLIFLATQWTGYVDFRARTEETLKRIDSDVTKLRETVDGIRLKQTSQNPVDPQNVKEAKQLLETAKNEKLMLDPTLIEGAGAKFLQASESNAEAWSATLSFLDYRSVLNENLAPPTQNHREGPHYDFVAQVISPINEDRQQTAASIKTLLVGNAPDADSARMELLSSPSNHGSGAQFIILEIGSTDTFLLDGVFLKNVIVRNAKVRYLGGVVKLENVYFVNCTFDFQLVPESRKFAGVLLTSASATFKEGTS